MKRPSLATAKLYFAMLGFVLTALGIATDSRPLVWAAIAVLAVALAIRLWIGRG